MFRFSDESSLYDFYTTDEAVILAGSGNGSESAPAALELVDGQPAIAKIAAKIMAAGIPKVYIATDRPELYAGFRGFFPVKVSDPGPLAGIKAILEIAESYTLLVLSCDAPGITTDIVERLLVEAEKKPAQVICASTASGDHPLCSVVNRGILPSVDLALEENRPDVLELFRSLDFRTVEFDDERPFKTSSRK